MIKKKCSNILCNEMIPRSKQPPYCDKHEKVVKTHLNKEYDRNRSEQITAFYKSGQWRRFRLTVLKEYHYLCQLKLDGCSIVADTVHHIIEVRDDWSKRFERENNIPTCRSCHNKYHERFS